MARASLAAAPRPETIGGRQKRPKRIERRVEKSEPFQDTRNALRQLGYPRFGGPSDGGAKSDNRGDHQKDEQKGSHHPGHPQPFERPQGRLH
jgi:hypothetical protein